MASSSGSRLLNSFLPRNDIVINCDKFIRSNDFSNRRKSKMLTVTITTCLKNTQSEEPDEDDDDGGGKKRHKISTWKKWVVGISLSVLLPSYRRKLSPVAILRDRVNEVIETTETVTEVVEDVAERVKSLAEELERRLPAKDADGKLKEALDLVEKLSEETIKTTDLAQELIEKVEKAGELLEDSLEDALEDALAIAEAKKRKENDSSSNKH